LKLKKIIIYDEPSIPEIKISNIVNFLQDSFSADIVIKTNFFQKLDETEINLLSKTRIFDIYKKYSIYTPDQKSVSLEKKLCKNSSVMENTIKIEDAENISDVVMYDGFEMQKFIREQIKSTSIDTLHIIFTNRLTCTFDESDSRYHGRAVICANPAIVSTTGIIEAPAKSKEFYIQAMANKSQGLDIDKVKSMHKGEFLEYHDARLSKIIEGYILQVIFYTITGESFCEYLDCRLNNAHWQRDLLYSQIEVSKLCKKHQKILDMQK
tara:strand:+ start:927 stop:1727 length:801 start_codon:yes stop_codon:yes gene_type:complete